MLLLDESNAAEYLRQSGRVGPDETIEVRELAGGVSNIVLHVAGAAGRDFVLKQAREQLRVAEEWFCPVDRISREVETLRVCRELLAKNDNQTSAYRVGMPEVLFEDRENFAFGMTSAPREHRVWKSDLLAGRVESDVAAACGNLLASLAIGGWRSDAVAERLGDRQFFIALRVEPYYRRVAEVHADVREPIERLIASLDEHRLTLVHGDFSPKNLLLFGNCLWLIDCEVGHFGDPAFDLGFFLTHLVLKRIRAGREGGPLLGAISEFSGKLSPTSRADDRRDRNAIARTSRCCKSWRLLAGRVDGKSRVDYLDLGEQEIVRRLARSLFFSPGDWSDTFDRIARSSP